MADMELLAPAGGPEALQAAVRTGADAVYLGGQRLNARRGAANFDADALTQAVSHCHVRGVAVYQTVNTVVFGDELGALSETLAEACAAGVDAVIVQDLAVVSMARKCCPSLPLHASTQMAVHNLDGVKALEQLGFSRVVLARELSLKEIEWIAQRSPLELEVFVHGALCVCVSGQCYLSSMIGGRSGNRGLCAQPCRLPFRSSGSEYALSLKDLSAVEQIPAFREVGVKALKIEGRLKRPEYVAAAVRACRQAMAGERPDMDGLRAVFSRGGFTNGYLEERRGDAMFGTRRKEDVEAASASVLKGLARLYDHERQAIPVEMALTARANLPLSLSVKDAKGNTVTASGPAPEQAIAKPTTSDRAARQLEKTGGTPFLVEKTDCDIDAGLMIPASVLNALRREALERLESLRGMTKPHPFQATPLPPRVSPGKGGLPALRVRLASANQLTGPLLEGAALIALPIDELLRLDKAALKGYHKKLSAELPRFRFAEDDFLDDKLDTLQARGISQITAGNLWGLHRGAARGFAVHGDFGLNITNSMALAEYARLGLADAVLSFELSLERARLAAGEIPAGLLVYGKLPLMAARNPPAGAKGDAFLTDRLGNRFPIARAGEVTELYNTAPLYLADRLSEFTEFDFAVLYFTDESASQCGELFHAYQQSRPADGRKTRGLYYREVR